MLDSTNSLLSGLLMIGLGLRLLDLVFRALPAETTPLVGSGLVVRWSA